MAHPTAAWHDQQIGHTFKRTVGDHLKSEGTRHHCLGFKTDQRNIDIGALTCHVAEDLDRRGEIDLVSPVEDEYTNLKLSIFFVLHLRVRLVHLRRGSCRRKPITYGPEGRKSEEVLRERASVHFDLLVSIGELLSTGPIIACMAGYVQTEPESALALETSGEQRK